MVYGILKNVLQELNKEEIVNVYMRSDRAGKIQSISLILDLILPPHLKSQKSFRLLPIVQFIGEYPSISEIYTHEHCSLGFQRKWHWKICM